MIFQRAKSWIGPWEDIPLSKVPPYFFRRYNRDVKFWRGRTDGIVVVNKWYYRFVFCV